MGMGLQKATDDQKEAQRKSGQRKEVALRTELQLATGRLQRKHLPYVLGFKEPEGVSL